MADFVGGERILRYYFEIGDPRGGDYGQDIEIRVGEDRSRTLTCGLAYAENASMGERTTQKRHLLLARKNHVGNVIPPAMKKTLVLLAEDPISHSMLIEHYSPPR